MKDKKIIEQLIEMYNRKFFNTSGSILDIFPNGLFFIKSKKYLKYIKDNIPNIHIIVSKRIISNNLRSECENFYPVDDVAYVFGEVHNYIFEDYKLGSAHIHNKSFILHLAGVQHQDRLNFINNFILNNIIGDINE